MDRGITIERFTRGAQHSSPREGGSVTTSEPTAATLRNIGREAALMSGHVCPWWIGYLLVSPLRRWMQNPDELIAPYVTPGMTVLEPGPGMGFFTLPLA